MKTILRITILSLLFIVLGCSKEDNEVPVVAMSDAKTINSFSFAAADNAALIENLTATITEASKTVSGSVPSGTDVTALKPTVQVSTKASVSPSGAQDFSSPVIYTVTAEDGSTAKYTASVTILELENSAPLGFELIAVTDNAIEVDVLPTFSWNAATDPDGDAVTYDLFIDEGEIAEQLYAENLADNSFVITDRLGLLQNYSWRVEAKDSNGAKTSSETREFITRPVRFNEVPETSNAQFPIRTYHTSVVFDNKLWVIGGAGGGRLVRNDVWFSEDGINWTEAINAAPFTKRNGHTSLVFDNKLWVIAGGDNEVERTTKNDVWYSEDGISWTEATDAAPFTARRYHTSAVFDNKLWVIGGLDDEGKKSDVWFSEDGLTWALATSTAPFKRFAHASVVFDNKLWVIGGDDNDGRKNDVWYSEDGVSWTEATDAAPFTARSFHTLVVFDNKLWIIGGREVAGRKGDVWFSKDGITWLEATNFAPFMDRNGHSSVVFDNKVWVKSGIGEGTRVRNDVWTFE